MEIQIGEGDGFGNRTANVQIRSPNSEGKTSQTLTTPAQRTPLTIPKSLFHEVSHTRILVS